MRGKELQKINIDRRPVKTVSSEIKEIEKTSEIQVVKAKFENKIHPHEKFKVRSWTQKFTSIKTKEKCIIWKKLKFKSGIYENKGSKRSFGVGVHHVNNVIKSVGNLCGKTIDHFASVRTINRI